MTSRTTIRWVAGAASVALVASSLAIASPAMAAKKKKTYKVSASASASSVKTSFPVTISGSVSPKSRASVKLQRYSAGKWVTIATKKLPKSSKYSFTTNVGKVATTLSYRVTKAKTKKIKAGVSKTVKVKAVTWGTVKAWGNNSEGELGTGATGPDALAPVNVKGLTEVVSVASSPLSSTVLALRLDGSVWSWGENDYGQLGVGTIPNRATPAKVAGLPAIKAVASSGYTSYALGKNGIVYSWGYNQYGELGNGTSGSPGTDRSTPGAVSALTSVKAISGQENGLVALRTDGAVYAWGYNTRGDIGTGDFTTPITTPRKVAGLPKITAIAASGDNAYAVGPYGTVFSWGYGFDGRLGNGTEGTSSPSPVPVAGLSGITRIGAGSGTAYAIGVSGTLWSWGRNNDGALGIGKTYAQLDSSPVPLRLALVGVRSTAGGDTTGYALLNNGTVRSWGYGSNGELGDGSNVGKTSPVVVSGLSKVTSIAGGYANGYAVIG